jgi:DNA-directed RNA polymerase specialized sigma24 family protein
MFASWETSVMRERFDSEFQALLDRDNPDTRSIWCFVERTIRQFGLDTCGITAFEILSEVYTRGIRQIVDNQKDIPNPLGWIRLTAKYVIHEYSRKLHQYISLETVPPVEPNLTVLCEMENLVSQEEIEADIQALKAALAQLTQREQEILWWRHTEDLTWCEVGRRLIDCGADEMNEATLRQQGYRALMRLRKLFHSQKAQDPGDKAA